MDRTVLLNMHGAVIMSIIFFKEFHSKKSPLEGNMDSFSIINSTPLSMHSRN
jgi:hypothetical protein